MSARFLRRLFLRLLVASAAVALNALPVQARQAPAFRLESTSGGGTRTAESYAGKVVLLMYEDRDSSEVNAALKAEVQQRIRQERLDQRLAVVPVADLRRYSRWGFRPIVRRAVVAKARELKVEILLDWSGDIFRSYNLRSPGSNVVLIGRDGFLLYQRSGPLDAPERRRFQDLLSRALAHEAAALAPGESVVSAGRSRAVVIGSGFGGLAAAVRLAANGWQVEVLERQDQAGGRARVFREGGFTFDAGPTVITAPFLFEELWALAGERIRDHVQLVPVDPFFRIRFHDGGTFEYSGDPARMHAEVSRLAPADLDGYTRFLDMSRRICEVGFQQLADVPFGSWRDMAAIVPDMLRLQSFRTVYGLVSRFVRDEKLRQVLSFHPLLLGGNPFTTTAIYSLIPFLERRWGVHFPIGGTGALVKGLVDLLHRLGSTIRYGATVEEILVNGRQVTGVRLSSGAEIPAEIVVSNADSAFTYRRLLPARYRRRWTDTRLERSRYSMGLFVWYFGTSKKYPQVDHHTILLGPRYQELLSDIFERRVLADDFSLYLHRPTATDPSLAPVGCDAFYVLSPVPHLQAGIDWKARAEGYRARIAQHLERTLLPGLSANLVASRVMTPEHFRDELLSEWGAGFGLEPVLTQSAYFRPHNRSEEVDGLYLVGAGTHPGAGVPGVLSSAKVLDRVIPTRPGRELPEEDLQACRTILRSGSKSFSASALLLPTTVQESATVLYAFCRLCDDLIDGDPSASPATVARLRDRLGRIYRGEPDPHPVDRALCQVVKRHRIPRSTFEALLEGLAWDVEGRRYQTMEALTEYCARVAGTVGVMMTGLMGRHDRATFARACDLGIAMQLTNIARDVGEDARGGRLYLPLAWLREAGIEVDGFMRRPVVGKKMAGIIRRLLGEAERLYRQADAGIASLPADCRVAIRAARLIYAEIGREIERAGFDSVSRRAVVSSARKLALLVKAIAGERPLSPAGSIALQAAPLPAAGSLIDVSVGAAA